MYMHGVGARKMYMHCLWKHTEIINYKEKQRNYYHKSKNWEELQDGGGVRCGDHLPPHKYITNTSTCGTPPTERLLNTGRRPQDFPKHKKLPTYLGRGKEKRKNRDKRIGTGPAPLGGNCEGGKVSTH